MRWGRKLFWSQLFRCILALFTLCGCIFTSALAATPTSLTIGQKVQSGGLLHLYFDLLDEQGVPMALPEGAAVSCSLGGAPCQGSVYQASQFAGGTGYTFAIDISTSLTNEVFAQVKSALRSWTDHLAQNDAVALLTFGDQVNILSDFSSDRAALQALIDGLSPTDNTTQLYNAAIAALNIASRQADDLPERRVVILLTDGVDESVAGATRSEVATRTAECGLPLWVIGFEGSAGFNKAALDSLGEIARQSGGACLQSVDISQAYDEIFQRTEQSYILEAELDPKTADDSTKGITLSLETGGRVLETGADIRLKPFTEPVEETPVPSPTPLPTPVPSAPPSPALPAWLGYVILGITVVAAAVILIVLLFRRRNQARRLATQTKEAAQSRLESELKNFRKPSAPFTDDATLLKSGSRGEHGTRVINNGAPRILRITQIHDGKRKEYKLALLGAIVVGRIAEGNTISVSEDETMSRHHFSLELNSDGQLVLKDEGSSNYTQVLRNGVPVSILTGKGQSLVLEREDIIEAGETRFEVSQW